MIIDYIRVVQKLCNNKKKTVYAVYMPIYNIKYSVSIEF